MPRDRERSGLAAPIPLQSHPVEYISGMGKYAEDVVRRLTEAFERERDPEIAVSMAAYMRGQFPFLGIPAPRRVAIQRIALAALPRPTEPEINEAMTALWGLHEREFQYAACDILRRNAGALSASFLPTARMLIETKSWWDTVDTLAANVVGTTVRNDRSGVSTMDQWVADSNIWVARCAILHQLKWKKETDTERLFRYCLLRADEREFFIRKAIGWALREYSKTDAAAVRGFVADHETRLSILSKREALLWLNARNELFAQPPTAVPDPGIGRRGSLPQSAASA